MRISIGTGLEIFTQPDDLQVSVSKSTEGDRYGILVTRGPGHGFKLLLSSEAVFLNREVAAEVVCDTLSNIVKLASKELMNPKSLFAEFFNPERRPVADMRVLTEGHILSIKHILLTKGVASTFEAAA